MKNKTLQKTVAVLFAIALWQVASVIVSEEMLLASPLNVLVRLFTLLGEGDFLATALFSLLRMTLGFLFAFVFGILMAVLASRFHFLQTMLWPFIVMVKAVPVASFIILCLIWFSFTQLTVFISFLIAFPVIYLNVLQGIQSVDPKMKEMAKLYRLSWLKKLLYIEIPNVKPFLISACSVAVGMSWKAGVAAEVIGNVNGSIGAKLYDAKIYLENADLLAWTVVIIVCSVVMEKLFIFLLKSFFFAMEKNL